MFERVCDNSIIARRFGRNLLSVKSAGLLPSALACLLIVSGPSRFAAAQELPLTPASGSDPEGVETLTQGPIHEAFANPSDLDPTPGPVVMRQPPPDIQEEPPEFMPEDSTWISRLLGLGRRARRLHLGHGRRPQVAAGHAVCRRLLDRGRRRLATRLRLLDQRRRERGRVSASRRPTAWRPGRAAPPRGQLFLGAGQLDLLRHRLPLAGRLLVALSAGLGLVPGPLGLDSRRLRLSAGLLGLSALAFRGQIFAPIYFQQPIYQQPDFVYRPWCVIPTQQPVHSPLDPAAALPLLLRQLLRPAIRQFRLPVVVPHRPRSAGTTTRSSATPACTTGGRASITSAASKAGTTTIDQHEDLRPPRTWREQQQVARHEQPAGRAGDPACRSQCRRSR